MKGEIMRSFLTIAILMTGCTEASTGTEDAGLERECFGAGGALAATIEHRLETHLSADAVYLRLTLDPKFVDNTYGATAVGWTKKRDFGQLVGSDHAQLVLSDGDGRIAIDAKLDYVSADPAAPAGYRSLGVRGGDGKMLVGDPAAVLEVTSSLARNLGERGYGAYTVDSPRTDAAYAPDPAAPGWEFLVVYEAWVELAAFGPAGFGAADVDFIHASPSKLATNTVIVEPMPCPSCDNPDGCTTPGSGGPIF
jgi:hypothetical protein